MRRLTLLLVSLVLLSIQSVLAQSFRVKGTVVSAEDNEPMIGVTIKQEGTSNGVVTDIDGNYIIEIKGASKATLAYSYVGCLTQKHVVKEQTNTLNITLAPDSKMMDEVVVVAYGVRKKGTIAGSVSAVKAEKIENVPAASFDQALQGQSTGLQVIASSGEPSKAATFQIRGTNSINSGKAPLFILDGVPISSSDFNTLSPNDIESISVLKDASSTSIYGARAANGVVVITSKRGLAMDKAKITLRAQYGFSELAQNNWKMMNTDERIRFEKEVGLDAGKDYNLLSKVNVNWLDEVFNDRAPLQSYELSINRATDRLNYYVSGGFYDQDGIAQNSTFRRYNIRTNADVKASKWLKVGTNTMAAYEEAQQADDGSYTTVTPISACRFMLPYWNPYAKDGSLASLAAGNWAGTSENPIVYMGKNPIRNKNHRDEQRVHFPVVHVCREVLGDLRGRRDGIRAHHIRVDLLHGIGDRLIAGKSFSDSHCSFPSLFLVLDHSDGPEGAGVGADAAALAEEVVEVLPLALAVHRDGHIRAHRRAQQALPALVPVDHGLHGPPVAGLHHAGRAALINVAARGDVLPGHVRGHILRQMAHPTCTSSRDLFSARILPSMTWGLLANLCLKEPSISLMNSSSPMTPDTLTMAASMGVLGKFLPSSSSLILPASMVQTRPS